MIKSAAIGALVGAILLTGVLVGWKIWEDGQRHLAMRPQPVNLAEEAKAKAAARPKFGSVEELADKLQEAGTCTDYAELNRLLNRETAAGECGFGKSKGRIAFYGDQEDVGWVLDHSIARTDYGSPLTVVAGENWIVTMSKYYGGQERADLVASALEGVVISR